MTAYERRVIPGGAPKMTLVSGLTTTTDLTFTVDSVPGTVPTTGPGFLLVDRGVAGEECVRWVTRSGTSFTLSSTADRGVAGTTAAAHTPGSATVEFAYAATDFDEANYTVAETVGQVTGKGAVLLGSGANALAAVTPAVDGSADGESLVVDHTQTSGWKVGSPVPAAHTHPESDVTALVAGLNGKMANPVTPWAKGSMLVGTDAGTFDVLAAGATGSVPTVQGDGSVAFAPGTAGTWGTYTPVLTGSAGGTASVGNGSLTGRFTQIGKTVIVSARWVAGTTTSVSGVTGHAQVSLPVAPSASVLASGSLIDLSGGSNTQEIPLAGVLTPGATVASLYDTTPWVSSPFEPYPRAMPAASLASATVGAGNWLLTLTYEAA